MLGRSPALLPLVCVIAAVFIADAFQFSAWYWWLAGILALILAFHFSKRVANGVVQGVSFPGLFFSLALATSSAGYFQAAMLDRSKDGIPAPFFERLELRFYGEVRGWPKLTRDRTELTIDLDSISGIKSPPNIAHPVHATIQVFIGDTTTFVQHGDRVQFVGQLRKVTPSSGRLGYHRYLERQGIQAQVYLTSIVEILRTPQSQNFWFATARLLREQLVSSLKKVLPLSEASLAAGFLVGETRDLSQRTMLLFRETGTLHLLAVSGANVWLMVGFLMLLFRPVPIGRLARTVLIIALLIVFMLMCYAEPSVVRATTLAILVLIGRLVGRKLDLLHLIAVAALLMLLVAPLQLFAIGFQLSFLTATALVATMLPLQEWLEDRRTSRWLQSILLGVAGSIVASLISAPLVWWYFERVSVMSIPANIIVAPLVSVSTIASLAAATMYQLLPPVGVWIGACAHIPLDWLMRVVEWFGASGDDLRVYVQNEVGASVLVVGFYVLAAAWLVVESKRRLFISLLIALASLSTYAGTVLARQGSSSYQMIVEPIPGGGMTLITRDGWQSADMLIHGLRSRRYPIDSVIVMPMLDRLGVGMLRTIVVKDIEYHVIDDILRLAASSNATTLLIVEDEMHAFRDWRAQQKEVMTTQIKIASGADVTSAYGIFADTNGLVWADSLVCITTGNGPNSANRRLLPDTWKIQMLGSSDRQTFQTNECDLFLCSTIEQRNRTQSDSILPEHVLDLSVTGGIRISLSDQLIIHTSSGETIFRKRPNAR